MQTTARNNVERGAVRQLALPEAAGFHPHQGAERSLSRAFPRWGKGCRPASEQKRPAPHNIIMTESGTPAVLPPVSVVVPHQADRRQDRRYYPKLIEAKRSGEVPARLSRRARHAR